MEIKDVVADVVKYYLSVENKKKERLKRGSCIRMKKDPKVFLLILSICVNSSNIV